MNRTAPRRSFAIPENWDRSGLPAWTYASEAFLALEKEKLFRAHWQIACHVSDVAGKGDYLTLDICGERALILRGADGQVRAFHNICRHRGSRVVATERGHCAGALVCPFHGWVYNLDGTLRGPAQPKSFPKLDRHAFGLPPIETEIWNGLVFIRLAKGPQPSVADLMAPFAGEIANYKVADMIAGDNHIWAQEQPVNWKSVRDVDNEGYHVALAHPGLQDLYGRTYFDEPFIDGVSRSFAICNPTGRRWSVRHYLKATAPCVPLPEYLERAWIYYGMFPNTVLVATPETFQFYQEFPLATGRTLLRGAVYRHREETRQQRIARRLAMRIDRETIAEDVQLSLWSNEAMAARAFPGFYLSDLEYGVKTHHDRIRGLLPISRIAERPREDEIATLNAAMAAQAH